MGARNVSSFPISPHFYPVIRNFFPNKLYYYFYYKKKDRKKVEEGESGLKASLNIVRACLKKKKKKEVGVVAHPYNPSNSGGEEQEDCGSKPAWANSETLS
jgi:hypothetical protein